MRLAYQQTYLSIDAYDPVDLPEFTVLTGVNGSGKSHLLEAIQNGASIVEGVRPTSIVHFNYDTFRLDNETSYSASEIMAEKINAFTFFEQQVRGNFQNLRTNNASIVDSAKRQAALEGVPLWNVNIPDLETYRSQAMDFFTQPHLKGNPRTISLINLMRSSKDTLDTFARDDFLVEYKPFIYKSDFLPQALGRVIWDYYARFTQNRVNRYFSETEGKTVRTFSDTQFVEKHGEKPWIVINNILSRFSSLEYRINSPEGLDIFDRYQMRLSHTRKTGLQIDFSNLSSGERILMALVAALYKASSDRHFPDLLLLDELDATLHPSMTGNMISVLRDTLLKRGTKVIIVTHSPSTVALSPEDSIYVMNRSGPKRIEKRPREEALSILTEGFATLGEGVLLFDQVSREAFSIVTEGFNTNFIKLALELYGLTGVSVIESLEAITGKTQLKTLFDFMSLVSHKSTIMFIWDCDAKPNVSSKSNTLAYSFVQNPDNTIAKKGIENMFPEYLMHNFTKTVTTQRKTIVGFDEDSKKDFESFIIGRKNKDDFALFSHMIDFINEVRGLQTLGHDARG